MHVSSNIWLAFNLRHCEFLKRNNPSFSFDKPFIIYRGSISEGRDQLAWVRLLIIVCTVRVGKHNCQDRWLCVKKMKLFEVWKLKLFYQLIEPDNILFLMFFYLSAIYTYVYIYIFEDKARKFLFICILLTINSC